MQKTIVRFGIIGFVLLSTSANAFMAPPACLDQTGRPLAVNNDQVLKWKTTTPNLFLSRAHVTGPITRIYPFKNNHAHFEIRIGAGPRDTLEVIYSLEFGAVPTLSPGMQVETCGDYITAFAPSPGNPASPDRAIIHWIHQSDSHNHQSGYLNINGVTYGLFGARGFRR